MLNKIKFLLKEENGQTAVLATFLMVAMLGIAALVLDFGYMTYQKSSLQNAADAAALSGAISLTKCTDAEVAVVVDEFVTTNLKNTENLVISPPAINRTAHTVGVEVKQTVPKFLAGVLTSDTYSLVATSKAKCFGQWNGDALPFINLDDDYSPDGAQIVAWEKTSLPGSFESEWKDDFDIMYPEDPAKCYFRVDYEDGGITVTKGVFDPIKQEVGYVYDRDQPVYIFSLSLDAMPSYSTIKNKDVIPLEDLVLLKCHIDKYDAQTGEELELTVLDVYDIADGEMPEDVFNADTRVTSKLVN